MGGYLFRFSAGAHQTPSEYDRISRLVPTFRNSQRIEFSSQPACPGRAVHNLEQAGGFFFSNDSECITHPTKF